MFSVVICDDEKVETDYLTKLVRRWADGKGIKICVSGFPSAEAFLFEYEDNKNFDLLLLDIQMNGIDGIHLAHKLRENGSNIQLAFITGFPDYIANGYDVSALHYLIKPVEQDKLFPVLNRAYDNLLKSAPSVIFKLPGEQIKVNPEDIEYIEAFAHSSNVAFPEKNFSVNQSISEISKMLGESFVRCHRSYLVNLRHIERIGKTELILDSGRSIPISRRLLDEVNHAFIEYYRGQKGQLL